MSEFAEHQPKDGDVVLNCGHKNPHVHCWMVPGEAGLKFRRPDNTMGVAKWIVACNDCFQKAGGDVKKIAISSDAIWQGDEPIFLKD